MAAGCMTRVEPERLCGNRLVIANGDGDLGQCSGNNGISAGFPYNTSSLTQNVGIVCHDGITVSQRWCKVHQINGVGLLRFAAGILGAVFGKKLFCI